MIPKFENLTGDSLVLRRPHMADEQQHEQEGGLGSSQIEQYGSACVRGFNMFLRHT